MIRFGAILVTGALFFSWPAIAQNLVSPKLLPPPAELRTATANASFGQTTNAQPAHPAVQKHWTKGGKIMTYIGAGLLGGGTGALAYGLSNENSFACDSGGTCIAVDWKWTGVGWMAAGGALMAVGLTRHSEY